MSIYNHKAFVGGALKQVIKGVPRSLKRLFTGKSNLKSEAGRVKNTFRKHRRTRPIKKAWYEQKKHKKYKPKEDEDWRKS